MNNKNLEVRYIGSVSADNESRTVTGLAIVTESRSELLGFGVYETIAKTAVNRELIEKNDIKVYLNHDESRGTLARSKYGNGSLQLTATERGLEFSFDAPHTALGDELVEGIRRGDYDAISFAFRVGEDTWEENEDGTYNRTIVSFDKIDEISILSCLPAYSATEVNLRSLDAFKETRTGDKKDEEDEETKSEEETPTEDEETKSADTEDDEPKDEETKSEGDEDKEDETKSEDEPKDEDEETKSEEDKDEEERKLNEYFDAKFALLDA